MAGDASDDGYLGKRPMERDEETKGAEGAPMTGSGEKRHMLAAPPGMPMSPLRLTPSSVLRSSSDTEPTGMETAGLEEDGTTMCIPKEEEEEVLVDISLRMLRPELPAVSDWSTLPAGASVTLGLASLVASPASVDAEFSGRAHADVDFVFVLDKSGSMRGVRHQNLMRAVRAMLQLMRQQECEGMLPPNDERVTLVAFDDVARVISTPASSSATLFHRMQQIEHQLHPTGGTDIAQVNSTTFLCQY